MKNFVRNSKGQISIFFATTILVIITFLAFVINIGVFVKAKLNLQNAVDAAAYAGAAVQARQLTNIAYVNWEMRNVYKEWMFKYYILGNLNINDVANGPSGANTSFLMNSYQTGTKNAQDRYNFPSVCIDFAGQGSTALCRNYIIPGLPRFSATNVSGMDETTNSIMDTLTNEKAKDCALRTKLNFATTNLWAYNVPTAEDNVLQQNAPEIASNRPGAFPTAFELAIRMRNLEAQVNKAPEVTGVCINSGNQMSSEFCQKSINDLIGGDRSASNERIYKAFYSGFRNLGSDEDTELRHSFTLKEIPPQPFIDTNEFSLSNLLIPSEKQAARQKYYLDLKLMTANLATFYTFFAQTTGDVNVAGIQATTEGQCASTKTGLPIPGYPMGFVKNPDVLTYYAVEGTAKFIGMFNPFDVSGDNGITLKAYAAAKPFGGRIGPMLFDLKKNETSVFPRADSGTNKYLSSAFISGIDSNFFVDQYGSDVPVGQYAPGAPLPIDLTSGSGFWQRSESSAVGGWLSANEIVFGIPNLIYDYPTAPGDQSYFSTSPIQVIKPKNNEPLKAGMYNSAMFSKFRANLVNAGNQVSAQNITDGIYKIRSATWWDANNYLIPSTEVTNLALEADSFGLIGAGSPPVLGVGNGLKVYPLSLYAPLYSDDPANLFSTPSAIISSLNTYLLAQEQAIQKYLRSMNTAAAAIYQGNISGGTGSNIGRDSARMISDIDDQYLQAGGNPEDPAALPSCTSITGKFIYFYYGPTAVSRGLLSSSANCGGSAANDDNHLGGILQKYFSNTSDNPLGEFYKTTYTEPDDANKIFTAYRPGAQNDANNGVQKNILNGETENMVRNFYSTKFITLKSLLPSGSNYYGGDMGNFPIFSEGNDSNNGGSTSHQTYQNPLKIEQLGVDISAINH